MSHNTVNFFRLGVKVAMPRPGKDDQLRIRNSLHQDISARGVRQVADDEMIVVAYVDQGLYVEVF